MKHSVCSNSVCLLTLTTQVLMLVVEHIITNLEHETDVALRTNWF